MLPTHLGPSGLVDWSAGGLVEWSGGWVGLVGWCGLVDWWIGGVEACSLGLGGLHVTSSTRDRDGSADNINTNNYNNDDNPPTHRWSSVLG